MAGVPCSASTTTGRKQQSHEFDALRGQAGPGQRAGSTVPPGRGAADAAEQGVPHALVAPVRRRRDVVPGGADPLGCPPGAVLRPVLRRGHLRRPGPEPARRRDVPRLRERAGDLLRGPRRAVRTPDAQLGRVAVRRLVARRPDRHVLHRRVPPPAPPGLGGRRAAAAARGRGGLHRRAPARRHALRHQPAHDLGLRAGGPGGRHVAALDAVRRRVPGERRPPPALPAAPGPACGHRRAGPAADARAAAGPSAPSSGCGRCLRTRHGRPRCPRSRSACWP